MTQHLVKTLEGERESAKFHVLWQRITNIATIMNMEPARRTVARQQHRANVPVEDVEAHYRVAYFYAFLDHTLNHLKTMFSEELEGALLATYLIPSNLKDLCDETVTKLKEEFQSVLPYPSGFQSEVNTWKTHMFEMSGDAAKHGACFMPAPLPRRASLSILSKHPCNTATPPQPACGFLFC